MNYREERKLDKTNGKLSNNYQEQTKDGKVLIDLKKLIIFIAGVINATTITKSKTERIQIIVKAAVNHLNLTELS